MNFQSEMPGDQAREGLLTYGGEDEQTEAQEQENEGTIVKGQKTKAGPVPPINNKYLANQTEGNEAKNPNAGDSVIMNTSGNLLNHKSRLDTEFEPQGSQAYQYNGVWVPVLPNKMKEPPVNTDIMK